MQKLKLTTETISKLNADEKMIIKQIVLTNSVTDDYSTIGDVVEQTNILEVTNNSLLINFPNELKKSINKVVLYDDNNVPIGYSIFSGLNIRLELFTSTSLVLQLYITDKSVDLTTIAIDDSILLSLPVPNKQPNNPTLPDNYNQIVNTANSALDKANTNESNFNTFKANEYENLKNEVINVDSKLANKVNSSDLDVALALKVNDADFTNYKTNISNQIDNANNSLATKAKQLDLNKLEDKVDSIDISPQSLVLVGSIIMWGTADIPNDYLELNGQNIDASIYPELSVLYGSNLPDFRGYFPRAFGTNIDGTSSGELLTHQEESIKSHTHYSPYLQSGGRTIHDMSDTIPSNVKGGSAREIINPAEGDEVHYQTTATGGNETRPKNIAIKYIIKAK